MDTNDSANPHLDDKLYEQVGLEMARKEYLPGPMARAVAHSKGDKSKIEAHYIQFRYEELRRQVELEFTDVERLRKRDQEERHATEEQAKIRGIGGLICFCLFVVSIMAFIRREDGLGAICFFPALVLLIAMIYNSSRSK